MPEKPIPQKDKECKVLGCKRKCVKKDLCGRHYSQMRKNGYTHGNPVKKPRGSLNKYIFDGKICRMELYDGDGYVIAHAIIDSGDFGKVKDKRWSMDGHGYVVWSGKNNNNCKLHQIILGSTGVDHVDGNLLDNRKRKLRKCSQQQNCFNCRVSKNNTSGITGVTWDKARKKWRSSIKVNYKNIYLGRFINIQDAAAAYSVAADKYFGEFARNIQVHPHTRRRSI